MIISTNAKIVVPTGSELVNIIGDMAGIVPLKGIHKENKVSIN